MTLGKDIFIPIKYKFLGVLMSILLVALGIFLFFAQKTFSEDKKLFVMDLNLTLLRATTSEVKSELKNRLEQLQILVPRILNVFNHVSDMKDPFEGLSQTLPDEVLSVTYYKGNGKGNFNVWKQYKNEKLIASRKIGAAAFDAVQRIPLNFNGIESLDIVNRSIVSGKTELPIITFLLSANFVNSDNSDVFVSVDFFQDFLRKKLQQSEIAEVFLVSKKGQLISHGDLKQTLQYSQAAYPHPIIQRVQQKHFPRESFEMDVNKEPYLINMSETGFNDIFAVSQIRKSEAFLALRALMQKSALLSALIIFVAVVFSILFATTLTSNIQKLKRAAQEIGQGNFQVKLNIETNDELQSVSESFNIMTEEVAKLIEETAQKARMADELETAKLVQSTLLTVPTITTNAVEVENYYVPASECGGDLWDVHHQGNKITALIGDATGHGAPAAIITAIAKSCFSTLNSIYQGEQLSPDQILMVLNKIIYSCCKGQILMTMCVVQLDLETGEVLVGNAGHESPLCVRGVVAQSTTRKGQAEVFFSRGERLGFDPNVEYEVKKFQLQQGDTIMLYTDGISEGKNAEGRQWGDRALKKTLGALAGKRVKQLKETVVSTFNQHTKGAVQEDDVTFLLLSWKGLQEVKKAA